MMIRRPRIRLDRGDTLGGTAPLILMNQISVADRRGSFLRRDERKKVSPTVWALLWIGAILLTAGFAAWRIGVPLDGIIARVLEIF